MKIEVSNPEFESCDDCIYSDDSEKVCIFRGCIHAVTQVKECYKPKQRTGKWIPVTERLPENKQEVLVTEYGETDIGRRFEGRWVDRYGDKMKDVTAWMPLPEPWRGEKRES